MISASKSDPKVWPKWIFHKECDVAVVLVLCMKHTHLSVLRNVLLCCQIFGLMLSQKNIMRSLSLKVCTTHHVNRLLGNLNSLSGNPPKVTLAEKLMSPTVSSFSTHRTGGWAVFLLDSTSFLKNSYSRELHKGESWRVGRAHLEWTVENYHSIAPSFSCLLTREIVKRNHKRVRWNLKKFFHNSCVCLGGDLHSGSRLFVCFTRPCVLTYGSTILKNHFTDGGIGIEGKGERGTPTSGSTWPSRINYLPVSSSLHPPKNLFRCKPKGK